MSHANVTVTRTVTSTHPNAIVINTGYLKTPSGLLKLLQLILGGIVIGIILKDFAYGPYIVSSRHYIVESVLYHAQVLFLLLMATTFFICTSCLLLSCLFSLSTGGLISKTYYEFFYHLTAFILLLIASVVLYLKIHDYPKYNIYNWHLSASIICLVNSIIYLASTALAFREYRY